MSPRRYVAHQSSDRARVLHFELGVVPGQGVHVLEAGAVGARQQLPLSSRRASQISEGDDHSGSIARPRQGVARCTRALQVAAPSKRAARVHVPCGQVGTFGPDPAAPRWDVTTGRKISGDDSAKNAATSPVRPFRTPVTAASTEAPCARGRPWQARGRSTATARAHYSSRADRGGWHQWWKSPNFSCCDEERGKVVETCPVGGS